MSLSRNWNRLFFHIGWRINAEIFIPATFRYRIHEFIDAKSSMWQNTWTGQGVGPEISQSIFYWLQRPTPLASAETEVYPVPSLATCIIRIPRVEDILADLPSSAARTPLINLRCIANSRRGRAVFTSFARIYNTIVIYVCMINHPHFYHPTLLVIYPVIGTVLVLFETYYTETMSHFWQQITSAH